MPFILLLFLFLGACQHPVETTPSLQADESNQPGWVSVFQTVTTDKETTINILRPRLAKLAYVVSEQSFEFPFRWDKTTQPEKIIKTTTGPHIHWAVDRIHVKKLKPGVSYRLSVVNTWQKKEIDWRQFKTLDIDKKSVRFIVGSCMSDSHKFEHVRNLIWDQMLTHDADFLMLLGDEVYVDDFDFVRREKANEFDIWTRYIDSFRKIPLFQNRRLIPILAVWDDHDYGTNNSNKFFKAKKAAEKVFNAFFGGEDIPGYYHRAKKGVYFSFTGFGQKFLFMDGRYYRDPNASAPYGRWGEEQHQWLKKELRSSQGPVWLANGDQFFTEATIITRGDGSKKQVNETFVADHPNHFATLLKDIKASPQPVVFLSGDIHYSEVVGIEESQVGYPTYEVTSSPLHSYIFRSKKGQPESWLKNPRRIVSVKEHNYLIVDSTAQGKKLDFNVKSFGVKQSTPYFEKQLSVQR